MGWTVRRGTANAVSCIVKVKITLKHWSLWVQPYSDQFFIAVQRIQHQLGTLAGAGFCSTIIAKFYPPLKPCNKLSLYIAPKKAPVPSTHQPPAHGFFPVPMHGNLRP